MADIPAQTFYLVPATSVGNVRALNTGTYISGTNGPTLPTGTIVLRTLPSASSQSISGIAQDALAGVPYTLVPAASQ